jgi:hypothetical protein
VLLRVDFENRCMMRGTGSGTVGSSSAARNRRAAGDERRA